MASKSHTLTDTYALETGLHRTHAEPPLPRIHFFTPRALNHLILLGLNHLQHVLDIYQDHLHNHRPHQGLGNCIPAQFIAEEEATESVTTDSQPLEVGDIECQEFLGGLLKSYSRKAA